MRTYKEPKRIDKPRVREPGIVNPDYVNRIAASYHQKNNVIPDGSSNNEMDPSGTNHHCDDISSPKGSDDGATCAMQEEEITHGPDVEEAENVHCKELNKCKDLGNCLGQEVSPLGDEEACDKEREMLTEEKTVLSPIPPPDCKTEDVEQSVNNVIVSEKADIPATSTQINSNNTTKKKKTAKPKTPKPENSDTKKPVKSKPGTTKKKTSPKLSKSKDTIHSELNGTDELKEEIDSMEPAVLDPSPPKKKKSINKSLPSKKSQKKSSKSKVAIENNVEELHNDVDNDDLDTSSKSDASSPRVSKRTPKKNRKYHSEEENDWPVKEDSESGKKKDVVGKPSVMKKSPIRKRKLLFEDDDIEEEENVEAVEPVPEEVIVKKPVKKKRKKAEGKTTEAKAEMTADSLTESTKESIVVEGGAEDAKSETVQKKGKKPRKKPAAKKPKTAVNENIPPTDIANGGNNVSNCLDRISQEDRVLATDNDSIEQKNTEDGESMDSKSNPPVCKKETSDVKKKKKAIKKPKITLKEELEKNTDVTTEECSSSVVKNETSGEIQDKPTDVKPVEVKKKATKKKKSIIQNQESGHDDKKDLDGKKEISEKVEKEEDSLKEVKEENKETDAAESSSQLPAIPVVKRPPVVITCQHCGHVSHSKGANTRHLRKCVVSILKGEGPMSPTRASSSGVESENKTNGPAENEENIKDVKATMLLQNQEIKKIETGTAGEAQYRCQHCTYATPKRAMLARHMRTHGIYVCLRCTFISDTHDSLKDHCHREHKDRTDFKLCRKCSRYVKCTEVTLEKHMEECAGPVPFICTHCSKEFKYESSLKSHIIRHNPDAPKRFHCEKCSYESNYKANLKKHMANIHGEKVKHVRCVHPDCEKMFYTEDSMRRHLKWHSEERPFKCPNCDKRFKTNTALRGHKVIHDPSRPFKCNINDCTKDFRSKKHLKNHQEEFHQIADKKFMCSQEACTFAFFKRSHLERHLITHTGERKFGCRICGRAFRHADNLKIHMRQHTNEKPVKCDLCDFACRQKSSLQYHLRKFHNIIPPSKEASNHVVAIDGVRKPASATVGSATGTDSNGSQQPEKKPLSPVNRSQNPMDLYEFKSDDEMDSDALLPLFQDKSLKSFRVNNVDKSENEKPVVTENKDMDKDTSPDLPKSQESGIDVPVVQESFDQPTDQENIDLTAGKESTKDEQQKPETEKKKVVKRKKKPKVVKVEEKEEEEEVKSKEEHKMKVETEEVGSSSSIVPGPSDVVAEDVSEDVTEVMKAKPKGKTKGKKKYTPKGTSPKAASPKGTSPKAVTPKGTKSTSPKLTTPKSSTPKASTPKSNTPKSPKAAVSKAAVSKAAKGKKAPASKKGRKAKVEQEEELPAKSETKPAPKRSPRTKAAASKKSPGSRKKPKAKKKKKEPVVAEDLDETDEYREDDDEGEEKEKDSFDLPCRDQDKVIEESKEVTDLGDPAFVDVIKYVEEHGMGNVSESEKPEQPAQEVDEDLVPEKSEEKVEEEDIGEDSVDMTPAEKQSKEEEEVTETVLDSAVPVAEPLSDVQSKVDEDSDRISSGIDTDFEEELKPPPAPRPPPVVDSDEGDIESGPEDIDTPGRDFESTPPKSVANSENIHSVQSHSGGEPRLESDFGDNISQPYRRSESQADSGTEVKRDHDALDALAVTISKTEPDDLSKQTALAEGVATSVVTGPANGDFGGSQSESTMPEVDKEYLGQYLQQFDSTARSEDEVSRLDRLDTTGDRAIDIPSTPQDKDLPPLNLSATAPPLNLTTTPEIPPEEIQSQPVQGTDMSNKRMEILECDRQHENHYQPSRSVSPLRPSERIPDNVYDSLSAITSYMPTPTPTPSTRETPVIRQTENIFPPVSASTSTTTTSSSSFMRFAENDALLQRQRMTTPFLAQSDPNALQNLHRMADSALASHSNSASLLRRPTTVPPREDMFPGPAAVTAQTMARNPFNSWAGVAGQEVRPAHWSQPPYLQRDRPANSTSSPLFTKDNYLSGREFMFDPSRRSVAERNMFPGLTQSTTRPELPHETFPMERFDFGYFGSHGYPTAPALQEYTRTQCGTSQKSLEERYRQTASGITDFSRAFPQTSTSEMFSSINMNTSFNLDKYMYNREPIYHPQHMGDSTNSPFLPHGVAPQHTMFDRDYPPRGFYQNSPYSFVNSMNDKQYAAAAAASAKLTHPTGSGVTQDRDFVPRPNTGAAAAPDNQIQDPYRNPLLYNMMNRYSFE
ncbi:uncharacterized protein LOC132558427 [Ylistrum balloti]|uniref:uncharacterized protein LOC132558427 n=1 Tax=Ylistrum balloti TaxID=509963 RepID=UPI002905B636|nr:uncharacterized protein LOC132558427 [Ylistrum balloti]